jgi:hypothetical protein
VTTPATIITKISAFLASKLLAIQLRVSSLSAAARPEPFGAFAGRLAAGFREVGLLTGGRAMS